MNRFQHDPTIHIVTPHEPEHPVPPGVQVHVRPDLDPELDVTSVDGIPCTTVERTIVDCSEEWDVEDIVEMLCIASRKGLVDIAKLEDTIRRVQHPRATAVAQEALDRWRRGEDL